MSQLGRGKASSPGTPAPQQNIVCSGWVLKKRRKKMQGFARRYFTLQADGLLSYSAHFQGSPRDHIILHLASISSSERTLELHIDSGTATFHLKCLSAADFDNWMMAFRKFMNVRGGASASDQGAAATTTAPLAKTDASSIRTLRTQAHTRLPSFSNKLSLLVQQMDKIIHDLEETISEANSHETRLSLSKKRSAQNLKARKDHGNTVGKESKDGHSKKDDNSNGLFGLFHRRAPVHSQASDDSSSTSGITSPFKEEQQSPKTVPSPVPSTYGDSPVSRLTQQIASLRTQHILLASLIESGNFVPAPSSSLHAVSSLIFNSQPLSIHTEEGAEQQQQADHRSVSGDIVLPRPPSSILSSRELTRRRSLATLGSTGESIWYDAEEGVEFFSVDAVYDSAEDDDSDQGHAGDGNETTPETMTLDDERPPNPSQISNASSVTVSSPPPDAKHTLTGVVRRTQLPSPTSGDEISLFTVLKRNVGKDLSTVAFPVSFNEPLSLLQHLAEDLEYTDLLEKAVQAADPVERLSFVAAFAVSGYACTKLRASRKPFNPMLGETFEDVRYKFIAEKVSHHPPIMACHAEGEGWEFWATSGGKNKFWGKSLEIIPVGTTYLKIGDETYYWQKPSSFMRNLIAGEKYLEHCGTMAIHSSSPSLSSSPLSCTLEFKAGGFWGSRDEVIGRITNTVSGATATPPPPVELRGRWHQSFSRLLDPSGSHLHVLWRAAPFPLNAPQYYGFTQFAIQLNEITPDIARVLPPTDSRWRPDQRALEEGRVDDADGEKARIEQAQRERRKQRELRGEEWKPRWFHPARGKDGAEEWVYSGGYWEVRESGHWEGLEVLW